MKKPSHVKIDGFHLIGTLLLTFIPAVLVPLILSIGILTVVGSIRQPTDIWIVLGCYTLTTLIALRVLLRLKKKSSHLNALRKAKSYKITAVILMVSYVVLSFIPYMAALDKSFFHFRESQRLERANKLIQEQANQENSAPSDLGGIPDSAEIYLDSAFRVMEVQSDYDMTFLLLDRALEHSNADSSSIYYVRGLAHLFLEEYNQAIAYFDISISMNSGAMQAYSHRAIAKQHIRDFNGARSGFLYALSLDSVYTPNYFRLGSFYIEVGEYQNAINIIDKGILRNPYNYDPFLLRATAKFEHGLLEEACADYKKAEELGMKEIHEDLASLCK